MRPKLTSRKNFSLLKKAGKLRKKKTALRKFHLLDASYPPEVICTQDGDCVFMNRAGLELFGAHNIEEVSGKKISDYIHPHFRHSAGELFRMIEENGRQEPSREMKILRLDGQAVDVETIMKPVHFKGKPGVKLILKQIPEGASHELRLRLQATILSQVNDAVVALDSDQRIIFWNKAAERLYKMSAQEAIGRKREDVFHYQWPTPEDKRAAQELLSSAGFLSGENIHILRSGESIQVESSVSVLTSWSGQPAGWLAVMRDITERKHAENALKEARNAALRDRLRLETILNAIPSGVFVAEGPDAQVTLQNDHARKILGREIDPGSAAAERIQKYGMRKPDGTLFKPEELPYRRALLNGELVHNVEMIVEQPDGRAVTILVHAMPLRDRWGAIFGSVTVFGDITQRKEAEDALEKARAELEVRVRERTAELTTTLEALQAEFIVRRQAEKSLRESTHLLENMFANIHVAIAYLDTRFNFIRVNQNYADMAGELPEFYQGKNLFAVFPDSENKETFENVVKTGIPYFTYAKPFQLEQYPDRGITYWDWSLVPVKEADGGVSGLVLTGINITERKKAEMERARLYAAIEAAAEAVVITEPASGAIQYVNSAFERITGFSRAEAVGKTLHILDSGRHDENFYRQMREIIERDGVWKGRLINKKKDGTFYYEDCTYSPVKDQTGAVVNYLSIKNDVTEKLMLESIAETVDTMNNIGYAFSGIRHEIGNPISSLLIILGLMKKKFDTCSRDTLLGYLNQAVAQVERVEYLLASLKNFNMYENLKVVTVETSGFIEKFISLMIEDLVKKDIEFEVFVAPAVKPMAADPRALQQALLNIIVNATDALTDRSDPKIRLETAPARGMVRLRVSDNGAGIPQAKQKDLFKPFYTSKAQGTGLGLVITKKLVSRMKGFIEITSRINEGTTVDVYIPEANN